MAFYDTSTGKIKQVSRDKSSSLPFAILSLAPAVDSFISIRRIIQRACVLANQVGLAYLWTTLDEARHDSRFYEHESLQETRQKLQKSALCLVYLDDLPTPPLAPSASSDSDSDEDEDDSAVAKRTWARCKWFRTVETLHDLIVPAQVNFYDANWRFRGNKTSEPLSGMMSCITGVPRHVLHDCEQVSNTSLGLCMSWAAEKPKKSPENEAYCLAIILGIDMSVKYGEGRENAFTRLQLALLNVSQDWSLFGWCAQDASDQCPRGLLARSSDEFRHFCQHLKDDGGDHPELERPWTRKDNAGFQLSDARTLRITGPSSSLGRCLLLEVKQGSRHGRNYQGIGIWLHQHKGRYLRVCPAALARVPGPSTICTLTALLGSPKLSDSQPLIEFKTQQLLWTEAAIKSGRCNGSETSAMEELSESLASLPSLRPAPKAGIKRSWSGQPRSMAENDETAVSTPSRATTPSSVEGAPTPRSILGHDDDGGFFSWEHQSPMGLDEIVDGSTVELNFPTELDCRSPPDHVPFQDLWSKVDSEYTAWLADVSSLTDSDETLSAFHPRKRAKVTGHRSANSSGDDQSSETDSDLVVVCPDSHPSSKRAFVCPYYAHNPRSHTKCLVQQKSGALKGLFRHLMEHHAQPPYCAVCCQTFQNDEDRDVHVFFRSCHLVPRQAVSGIDRKQMDKARRVLLRSSKQDDSSRWRQLWANLFPGTRMEREPDLREGAEKRLFHFEEFWNAYGHRTFKDETLKPALYGLCSRRLLKNLEEELAFCCEYSWT